MKFYKCKVCSNKIIKLEDSTVPVVCCGSNMEEIVANTTDAAVEKHVPVVEKDGCTLKVTIGSTLHPMEEAHHIAWVYVETKSGGEFKYLPVGSEPKVEFCTDEDVVAVYEYCNLHGLWKKEG